jgi:hypothetical protein
VVEQVEAGVAADESGATDDEDGRGQGHVHAFSARVGKDGPDYQPEDRHGVRRVVRDRDGERDQHGQTG